MMIKNNLTDYIGHFKNIVNKDFCDNTLNEIKNLKWQQHSFYDNLTKQLIKKSGSLELDIAYNYNLEISKNTKQLMSIIGSTIHNYLKNYGNSYFNNFVGHSFVRFNRYEENKKMAPHCDHISSLFDGKKKGIPILSVLGLLNDNFEGGEFVMFEDYKINFNKGDIVIFPSIFLYPHRVEPVTKGTRYSYISWVW